MLPTWNELKIWIARGEEVVVFTILVVVSTSIATTTTAAVASVSIFTTPWISPLRCCSRVGFIDEVDDGYNGKLVLEETEEREKERIKK